MKTVFTSIARQSDQASALKKQDSAPITEVMAAIPLLREAASKALAEAPDVPYATAHTLVQHSDRVLTVKLHIDRTGSEQLEYYEYRYFGKVS